MAPMNRTMNGDVGANVIKARLGNDVRKVKHSLSEDSKKIPYCVVVVAESGADDERT